MGQKVNPNCLRLKINRMWDTKWYADKKKYVKLFHQDLEIEKMIRAKLLDAGIAKIEILRTSAQATINIYTAKPGIIIGRGGETIEKLREQLEKKFKDKFSINIVEVKNFALDAYLLAESIAKQIEKRISYRRAAKMAIEKSREAGAQGVKVRVSGRLNGVEISRQEFFSDGKIPLHTFRADIDYAKVPANTTYGAIGVKVWIYKGDVFETEGVELQQQDIMSEEISENKEVKKEKTSTKK